MGNEISFFLSFQLESGEARCRKSGIIYGGGAGSSDPPLLFSSSFFPLIQSALQL